MDVNGKGKVTTGTTTPGTPWGYTLTNACPHRLPCGYCSYMNMPCANPGFRLEETWNINEVTCKTESQA